MIRESYSANLLIQGKYRFYQLAMPSDVLANCTFVSTRHEDPDAGFQRTLDERRAEEIARYIDSGLGTIPTSVILSAQEITEFEYDSKNKTVSFSLFPKSFLIIDGQHRVYGFKKAETKIRVPVVIYDGLNRRDESRLFIDVNSKQKGVPNELLLDIKKQAEYENSEEELFRALFDRMSDDRTGPLYGLLSAASRSKTKISRVTFNNAIKNIYHVISNRDEDEVLEILSNYLTAVKECLVSIDGDAGKLVKSATFRAIVSFFPQVGVRVQDKYVGDYSVDNFSKVIKPLFARIQSRRLVGSQKEILSYLERNLSVGFAL